MEGKVLITNELRLKINKAIGNISIVEFKRIYNINRSKAKYIMKGNGEIKTYLETKILKQILNIHFKPDIVDGNYFCELIKLWKFFNPESSNKSLAKEYGNIDIRYFNGVIKRIPYMLEQKILENFSQKGFTSQDIEESLFQLRSARVPYNLMIPLLKDVKNKLNIAPTAILGRNINLYKNGNLKTVPRKVYEKAKNLCDKIDENMSEQDIENINASFNRREPNFFYKSKILKLNRLKQSNKNLRKYLGPNWKRYEKGIYKKISQQQSKKIDEDYDELIGQYSGLVKYLKQIIDKTVCSKTLREGFVNLSELHNLFNIEQQQLGTFIQQNKGYFNEIVKRKDFNWRVSIDKVKEIEVKYNKFSKN